MAEVSADVKDASSGAVIPIDGVSVPSPGGNPTSGQGIRPIYVIGKSDGSANYADPDGAGNLKVNVVTGSLTSSSGWSTATITSIAASITSVVLLAANANRKAMFIMNDSASATLNIAFAATASTSAYTGGPLPPGASYESSSNTYTGIVSGIWSAAIGNARMTEGTP